MIRKLSFAAVVATAALAVAPSAFGQGPDAFERAVNARVNAGPSWATTYPDAFERAVAAEARSRVERYPDAFQRALGNRAGGLPSTIPGDHHDRSEALSTTAPASVSTSGTAPEWPQIGIGFGVGALLALGLMITVRLVRAREPAH
ncbi:MAG TPA: hypothetical protein VNJ46_02075 [Gaiellaceae bacterium]|nr:hypothetical protein [Gaiellaceae bacterium]